MQVQHSGTLQKLSYFSVTIVIKTSGVYGSTPMDGNRAN